MVLGDNNHIIISSRDKNNDKVTNLGFYKIMALVCYHGIIPHRINQDRANVILQVMANQESRRIIYCIKNESKPVIQISKETGMSVSTIYRKLRELDQKKLVTLSGDISSERRKPLRFKGKISKIIAVFDGNEIDVRIFSNFTDKPNSSY